MAISPHLFTFNEVYRGIANRFWTRHGIRIGDYIETMKKIGVRIGQGITFITNDHQALKTALAVQGRFELDNRRHLCDAVAALATAGEGYREPGVPSLHCQISSGSCNIHLDSYGFVAIGPDGRKYYNPDLVQHIVDELGWATIVGWLDKKKPALGQLLGRIHPTLPNSRNRFAPIVGGKFVLKEGQGWSLSVDSTVELDPASWMPGGKSQSRSTDWRTTANLEVLHW